MAKKKVFVLMPFSEEFFKIYDSLKERFEKDFIFSHAKDEDNPQNILKDVIQSIYEADVIIANLTDLNPNVFYELGIAHTLNKKVIMITEDISSLPFDLKNYRAKEYSTHFIKFNELIESLDKYLKGAINGDLVYSNPVTDFLITKEKDEITESIYAANSIVTIDETKDKGFLDYLNDIINNTNKLSYTIGDMAKDMDLMTDGINECTNEINRVSALGGNNTNFIRKEAKKAAQHITNFSSKLHNYNQEFTDLWDEIEKDTLGLINNKFALQNVDELNNYLKSLKDIQKVIIASNKGISVMKEASLNNLGIERTLNQAISFLDSDLANYLAIMGQIYLSIDKIMEKSEAIVGKVECLN